MKYWTFVLAFLTFMMNGGLVNASDSSNGKVSDKESSSGKIRKRAKYCSPLDRWMKLEHCKDDAKTQEKEAIKRGAEKGNDAANDVFQKIKKKEEYCSPLEKATKTNNCK